MTDAWLDRAAKLIPQGYEISEKGITKDGARVCGTPVFVDAQFCGDNGAISYVRLSWLARTPKGPRPRCHLLSVSTIASRSKLATALVEVGVDATGLPQTHAYLLAAMAGEIPIFLLQTHMGWNEDRDRFLFGEWTIGKGGMGDADPTSSTLMPESVYLDPGTPRSVSDTFGQAGESAGWVQAMKIASRYPRVTLAVYASLVPAFQRILGLPSFAVQWAGATCTGKTTALMLAASVWGNPQIAMSRSLVHSFDESMDQLVDTVFYGRDLPLIVDGLAIQKGGDHSRKAQTILSGSHATQRTATRRFTPILLTAGVHALEDVTGEESVAARSVVLWGPPFGKQNITTARDVAALRAALSIHYGHLGPMVVQQMLERRSEWIAWKQAYGALVARFQERAATNGGVASACSVYVSALAAVADIVHSLLPDVFAWDYKPVIQDVWTWFLTNGPRRSKAIVARDYLLDWVAANAKRFIVGKIEGRPPYGGYVGRITDGGVVWISSAAVQELLVKAGYDPPAIYREWGAADWISNQRNDRHWKVQWLGRNHVRCLGLQLSPEELAMIGFDLAPKQKQA